MDFQVSANPGLIQSEFKYWALGFEDTSSMVDIPEVYVSEIIIIIHNNTNSPGI